MKRLFILSFLAICSVLPMWAEAGVWTNEYNKNECANSFEITPDKPYAEFWLGYLGTYSSGTYEIYVTYTNSDAPDLEEKYLLHTVKYNIVITGKIHQLKCGSTSMIWAKDDLSVNAMRWRVYFSNLPKTGTIKLMIVNVSDMGEDRWKQIFEIKDGSNITVIDPILDTQVDPTSGSGKVGQQKLYITSTADITKYRWTDSGSSQTYSNTSDTKSVLALDLPPTDKAQKRTIELFTEHMQSDSWDTDWSFMTTQTVEYLPFHSVKSETAVDMDNPTMVLQDKDPSITAEDFQNGKRRYIAFRSDYGGRASYKANMDMLKILQQDYDSTTLFTLVKNAADTSLVRIYPYGSSKPLRIDLQTYYIRTNKNGNDLWRINPSVGSDYKYHITNSLLGTEYSWCFVNGYVSMNEFINGDPHYLTYLYDHGTYEYSYQHSNKDEEGLRHPKNVIRWFVENYDDGDVMDGDEFLIQRATKADFSDATTIGSCGFDEYKEKTTRNGVVTASYEFTDEDESALYNKNERALYVQNGTLPKMYYRVVRSIAYGLWPDNMGSYAATSAIELQSVTPSITDFYVSRSSDWENDKRAVLKVKFDNPKDDASGVRKYVWDENTNIIITRKGYEDIDRRKEDADCAKTITIKGTDVVWDAAKGCYTATVEDALTYPYTYYFYEAAVDTTNAVYPTKALKTFSTTYDVARDLYNESGALVSGLTATQATENGKVVVEWEADDGLLDGFSLTRSTFIGGSGNSSSSDNSNFGAEKVLLNDTKATTFVDDDVAPDSVYRYTVSAKMTFRGKEYQNDKYVIGWASGYGKLSGQVVMANGAAMPGKITINAVRKEALERKEVVVDKKTCIPSLHIDKGKLVTTECDENGCFTIDSLAYNGDNTYFDITATVDGASISFENSQGVSGPYAATLSRLRNEYSDITFICNDEHRITGRVLFENSTVPVRDVSFKVFYGEKDLTGHILKDASGEDIVTNQTGNFDFYVPKTNIRIQAYKEGHTMKGEGYIKNQNDEVQFVPSRDLAGLQIADQTKVRLIGRLCGGDIEGDKPVGFELSKNNLGDNLTMVLQLEGDNTAQIVYHDDNPDNTTDNYTAALGTDTTRYTFEKKRILIYPNTRTGEFAVDLFPAKYKITQLSATGYSSLYSEGEGFQVVDLSTDSVMEVKSSRVQGVQEVIYNAIYKKVYHNPVTVTYKQSLFGMIDVNYIGEQKIKVKNLANESVTIQVADKKTGDCTFGVPVFKQGSEYTLRVSAHEDYYYNGVTSSKPDQVHLNGGKLIVRNGLVSATSEQTLTLDTLGTAMFTFTADNPEFRLTGTDAQRSIRMQVDINGRYYDADPLYGYVLGSRANGTDVLTIPKSLSVVDVIRDPMGSGSFAYREKGTQYKWSHELEGRMESYNNFEIAGGYGLQWATGIGYAVASGFEVTVPVTIKVPLKKTLSKESAEYTMTLNERIQTSDNEYDQGAQADVYVGAGSSYVFSESESVTLADSTTYSYLSQAIASGAVSEIASGETTDGQKYYILRGSTISIGEEVTSTFAYSQKHILGILIPELEQQRNALLRTGMDDATAQLIANNTEQCVYVATTDTAYSWIDPVVREESGYYKCFFPNDGKATCINRIDSINRMILGWREMIDREEQEKIAAFKKTPTQTYDIAGTEVSYSETATNYYQVNKDIDLKADEDNSWSAGVSAGKIGGTRGEGGANASSFILGGVVLKFSYNKSKDYTQSENYTYYKMQTAERGYTLKTSNNSYQTIAVYNVENNDVGEINGFTDEELDEKASNHKIHSFRFRTLGGASRAPWFPADSTKVYVDPATNQHLPLGEEMKKIDNPTIYIDDPVKSNVPQNEKAVFTVRLANETEIADASQYLTPTTLTLYVDDASNPNGAKIYMDGRPITDGRQFFLEPGKSIVKTIEVERGSGYDFENLRLILSDLTYTLDNAATLSVHFLPEATTLSMKTPDDKWVMNTLSAKDEDGLYYIPVSISDFDINSEDFHHIEFQYKKHTEGESQWVNLCSYYAKDDSIYQRASGEKALIENGSISNIRFYGEKDPIEMEYDLRAVSFRSWGTGFVTRSSNVVSGMKDTRPPKVFGLPKPTSGILTYEDVISLPFSEEIAYNYLDETANFQVQGYTNNSDIDESSYLRLGAMGGGTTKVDRNISMHDFTIDMLLRTPKPNTMTYPMIVGDTLSSLVFCLNDSLKCLSAWMNGREYRSATYEGVDFTKGLVHVGMVYSIKDSTVNFIVGEKLYQTETVTDYYEYFDMADSLKGACHANGPVKIQTLLGELYLKDIRLWNKALTAHEIAATKGKRLTGTEPGLLCYWPLDETQGNIAVDKAGGADLYLSGTTWETPSGHSLRLENKSIRLQHTDKFQRAATDDYTLSIWFKADEVAEKGTTTLLQAGQQGWRIGFEDGQLKATSGTQKLGNLESLDSGLSLSDHSWHHLAISVSHTHNTAAFMFDGSLVEQTQADSIGGFASDMVRLGSEEFKGNIDNLTFWHVALPVNYIKSTYNTSPSGKEMELQVYLPFSMNQKNDQGTIMEVFSPYNMVINSSGTYSKDTMLVVTESVKGGNAQAPIRSTSGLSNLPFTWTCTDTELQINIDKNDSEINHQQINITVREVEDLRGNSMPQPQMWTVYVDRNVLKWNEQTIYLNQKYGESVTWITSWKNQSGRYVEYTIDNNCGWLTIDTDRGEAKPTRTENVTLTVSDGLAPGEYSTVLYLIDENGLSSPLEVNVTVTADEPEWTVTTNSDYNQMMNLVGQVKVTENNHSSYTLDERDIVAAFYNNVCIGKSYIKVKNNTSYIYMNIVGKTGMDGGLLDFYHWNASTNQTSLLDVTQNGNADNGVVFVANSVVGTVEKPVQLETSTSRIQSFDMLAGWNWISLNIEPRSNTVQNLFVSNSPFTPGDKITTMNGGFLTYVTNERGEARWTPNDADIQLGKDSVYQVYMQHAGTLHIRGKVYDEKDRYITLFRKGWNSMPYLLEVDQPINVAMSDYLPMDGGKAMPETVIKSHDAFAMAGKDGRWYGTLEYMHPGEGYYVRHLGSVPCKISYTNVSVNNKKSVEAGAESRESRVQNMDYEAQSAVGEPNRTKSSMPIVALFDEGVEYDEQDLLVAIVDDEIVGITSLIEGEDGKKLFFLTVNSEDGKYMRFAQVHEGEIVAITSKPLAYSSSTVTGTMENPYLINFNDSEYASDTYSVQGIKLSSNASRLSKHVYIVNGKKILEK